MVCSQKRWWGDLPGVPACGKLAEDQPVMAGAGDAGSQGKGKRRKMAVGKVHRMGLGVSLALLMLLL